MARFQLKQLFAYVAEPLSQLSLLVRETLSLRVLLLNRFVIIVALVLSASIGANAYMNYDDGDHLTGTVVTENGTPVGNATVAVDVVGIENIVNSDETRTDAAGRFAIPNYSGTGEAAGMELRIRVTTEDGYQSSTIFRHAYFPDQNMNVRITLEGR